MPTDQNVAVKLLDAKVQMIFDLLKGHPLDEAVSILENAKIELEALAELMERHADAARKVAALEAEAETIPA